jgi:hypothetical protein
LETLKVVAKPNFNPTTAEERRRHKLIVKLQEQLCLAEAQLGGSPYRRMRWVDTVDGQGEPHRVQRPVRVKEWWCKNVAGSVLLTVRYGAKLLPIANGMAAIEVGSLADLPNTITTVLKAVDAGELDTELAAASKDRGFIKLKSDKKSQVKK